MPALSNGFSLSAGAHDAFVEKLAYESRVKEGRGVRRERHAGGPR
jgi:hypothetical protein